MTLLPAAADATGGADRPGAPKLVVAMLMMGLPFLLLGRQRRVPVVVLVIAIFVVGEMLWVPTSQSIVAGLAPADLRGAYMGAFGSTAAVGFALAPFFGLQVRRRATATTAMWGMFAGARRRGRRARARSRAAARRGRVRALCCTGQREARRARADPAAGRCRARRRRASAGSWPALAADLEGSPLVGKPLPLRLRNFRPSAEGYLASLGGPLPYMVRLREIEERTAGHEQALGEAWRRARRGVRRRRCRRSRALAAAGALELRRGERPDRAAQPLVSRWSRGCRWTRSAATTRSSTARTTAKRRSTLAWVLERFPPRWGAASAQTWACAARRRGRMTP